MREESMLIQQEWQKLSSKFPMPFPHLSVQLEMEYGEEATIALERSVIHLKAKNPLTAHFALNQLSTAIAAKHSGEMLGTFAPRFSLRPLMFIGKQSYDLGSGLSVAIPQDFGAMDAFCHRLVALGYNSIIFASYKNEVLPTASSETVALFHELCRKLNDLGLQVVLKLDWKERQTFSPSHPESCESLLAALHDLLQLPLCFDKLLWESCCDEDGFYNRQLMGESLRYEVLLQELRMLETAVEDEQRLVYLFSSQAPSASRDFNLLCDDAGKETILAFPSDSKIWRCLRKRRHHVRTPLLPILNVGCVKLGEGLWPIIPLEDMDYCSQQMHAHRFIGLAALTCSLPKQGSILDCALFLSAKIQWSTLPAQAMMETWFAAYHPEVDVAREFPLIKEMWRLTVKFNKLRAGSELSTQFLRLELERSLSQLNQWQLLLKEDSSLSSFLSGPLRFFLRDAKRWLLQLSQVLHIPLAQVLEGDDLKQSFWTEMSQGISNSLSRSGQVALLNQAIVDTENKEMEKIYSSTYLYQ